MKNKLIVKKKAHEHLLCIHTLDVVNRCTMSPKIQPHAPKTRLLPPWVPIMLSMCQNRWISVIKSLMRSLLKMQVYWIKRYEWLPWVIKLSSDSVVNLTLFSLIFHSIRGEIQREEGQWKLGIRQADVTTTVLRTSHSWSREYIDFVIVHWICILTGPFVLNKIMVWYMYTNNYTAGIFISLLNSL